MVPSEKYDKLNKYDWLRLVLYVPPTPEQRDQKVKFDPEFLADRIWKWRCDWGRFDDCADRSVEAQPEKPATEKTP